MVPLGAAYSRARYGDEQRWEQFKGPTAWEDYLSALEAAIPHIEAIAVTDYYVT